jgi:hypothetical protein
MTTSDVFVMMPGSIKDDVDCVTTKLDSRVGKAGGFEVCRAGEELGQL